MTVILGLNAFHADAAACLVVDGQLVGAVAEERLGKRIKHDPSFPLHSIRHLLLSSNLRLSDVTHVAIARDTRANRPAKLVAAARQPIAFVAAATRSVKRNRTFRNSLSTLSHDLGEPESSAKFETVFVEHHLAHIASAYYLSPFDSLTAGFSYDASGDFASMMAARCEGTRIDIIARVALPASLGFFYTAMCQFIGFRQFGEEYKVMGLAPYGEDAHRDLMAKLVKLSHKHWFQTNHRYIARPGSAVSGARDVDGRIFVPQLFTNKLVQALGNPRAPGDTLTQREMNIARSTQVRFEEAAVHCLRTLYSYVPSEQLAMAGGCALNGVANARIIRDTHFNFPYLQAASSDDGTCLGAAYYCWHNVIGRNERFHMQHAFWGPKYSGREMQRTAFAGEYPAREFGDEEELVNTVADLLLAGKVVGWYQGRSEWGPRALGNRSILANPTIPNMKDIINKKVKKRESFRPFAPSVLVEYVSDYFEQSIDSPFMMHVVKVRKEWRERLPAITHVDGTGRLQTVSRENNHLYHRLIDSFRRRSGVAMLLNTSFNENEPVVDTPQQAYDCFRRTDIDVLCLGNNIIAKSSNDIAPRNG